MIILIKIFPCEGGGSCFVFVLFVFALRFYATNILCAEDIIVSCVY